MKKRVVVFGDLPIATKVTKDLLSRKDVDLIGVINTIDSYIAREVDYTCYLNIGKEIGVASTKSFLSQVIMLSIIALYFCN